MLLPQKYWVQKQKLSTKINIMCPVDESGTPCIGGEYGRPYIRCPSSNKSPSLMVYCLAPQIARTLWQQSWEIAVSLSFLLGQLSSFSRLHGWLIMGNSPIYCSKRLPKK